MEIQFSWTIAAIFVLIGIILVCAAIIFAQRQVEEERKEQPKPHVHRWRQITEFARQCDDRRCAVVEVSDGAPDGMPQYLSLMTTPRAREHPIEEAEIYASLDPKMNTIEGAVCQDCERIYPKYFPWCPFCDERPIPHMIFDEGVKQFVEASPQTLLRLEQERRERIKSRHVERIAQQSDNN